MVGFALVLVTSFFIPLFWDNVIDVGTFFIYWTLEQFPMALIADRGNTEFLNNPFVGVIIPLFNLRTCFCGRFC